MKNYKEVEMLAKNAPTGSYAAGCPTGHHTSESTPYGGYCKTDDPHVSYVSCEACEIAH